MSNKCEEGVPVILDLSPQEAVQQNVLSELLYLRDVERRVLTLDTEITEGIMFNIVRDILDINAIDEENNTPIEKRKPIRLYINSIGGDLVSTLGIIDAIKQSETPVYTINLSRALSGGFFIFICGHKRYSMEDASFLLHEGTRSSGDSASKAEDHHKYILKLNAILKEHVLSHSNLTPKNYNRHYKEEWYMMAAEAKSYGFVDYIVGEDGCRLKEILP